MNLRDNCGARRT